LSYHAIRGIKEVCRREAKQLDASREEAVLAAVVLSKVCPVGGSVVFNSESVMWVIEIRPADKSSLIVVKPDLSLWTG